MRQILSSITRPKFSNYLTTDTVRTISERVAFESQALQPDLFVNDAELMWWRRTLSRLLSLVDPEAIATKPMRELREELAATGELTGNPPTHTGSIDWGPHESVLPQLAGEGVDTGESVHSQMLAQSKALYDLVQTTPSDSGEAALRVLWTATLATIGMYDANRPTLHERVERPVWGHVSNAVERIAFASAYVPGGDGLPSLDELIVILERLWGNRFPEPCQKGDNSSLSWGNLDVRVYAAKAYVELARRFSGTHREFLGKFDVILADSVPEVRLQAAERLLVLWNVEREKMWCLAEQVARAEPHAGVLALFLQHVVSQITWHDLEKCKAVIEVIRSRRAAVEQEGNSGRDNVAQQLGGLTAQLWCWQGETTALTWLEAWLDNPAAHREYFTSFLSVLRSAFFTRYASGKEHNPGLSDRSQAAAMTILDACSAAADSSYITLTSGTALGTEREALLETYRASERVIGHLANQIYFGSGAHTDSDQAQMGLTSTSMMREFLLDYRLMLTLLANSREPSTHHKLVELYEFLIPGDPTRVFDSLHALLTGPAARQGYHHEGLAAPVIVRMITRYIADHRSIFEDSTRRAALVEILRLFSDVGWPDALKLLYELPDLLR